MSSSTKAPSGGSGGAQRVEEFDLRARPLLQVPAYRRLQSSHLVVTRGTSCGESAERACQGPQRQSRIGENRDVGAAEPVHLGRIDVDANRRNPGCAPRGAVVLEAGADREHGVGAFPTLHGSRLGHRQRMTVVQDAPAHAVRDHGRLQVLRDVAQRLPA